MFYYPRLKDLREDKELLQKDIAKILKTSERQYGRWETGYTQIPAHHLIKLADFYDTSTDYILGRTNDIRPSHNNKTF